MLIKIQHMSLKGILRAIVTTIEIFFIIIISINSKPNMLNSLRVSGQLISRRIQL